MSSLLFFGVNNHQNLTLTQNQANNPQKPIKQRQRQRLKQVKCTKLIIDPQKIIFIYDFQQKTIVSKLILKNNYSFRINFKIIQPKKSALHVKCKKFSLNSKQTIQIFIFFNTQKQKIKIQDQLIIFLEKQKIKLHIPIICKPKQLKQTFQRQSIDKKGLSIMDNENKINLRMDQKILINIQKGKKASIIDLNSYLITIVNNFMDKYSLIHQFVKEKNVKKQIFIGQKALSYEKHKKIIQFNQQLKQFIQKTMKQRIQSRLAPQFSQQGPVLRNFDGLILRWNKDKNISRMVYDKGLNKIQQQIRKYIVNIRFDKIHRIFSLYREFQSSNQHNNLPLHKKHQIYVQKLQKRLNKKSQTSLELIFDKNSIIPQYFEMQYQIYSQKKRNHIFQINPRIGFDNWVAIQQSVPYTHQIMNYSSKKIYLLYKFIEKQSISQWQLNPKLLQNKKNRKQLNTSCVLSNNIKSNNKDLNNYNNQLFNSFGNNCQLDDLFQSLSVFKVTKQDQIQKQNTLFKLNKNQKLNENKSLHKIMSNNVDQNQKKIKNINNNSGLSKIFNQNSLSKQKKILGLFINQTMKKINSQYLQQEKRILNQKQINEEILNNFNIIYHINYQFPEQESYFIDKQDKFNKKMIKYQYRNKNYSRSNLKILPFLNQKQHQQFSSSNFQAVSNQKFILSKLSKSTYNMDYLNKICFSRHQFESFKQKPNRYFLQYFYPFKNNLICKISKQDKYQFDRLDQKSIRILQWIQNNQKQDQFNHKKGKGQIDMEIPVKNKIKNFNTPGQYEKHLENLQNYQNNLLKKCEALQVYIYQNTKNKSLAFLMQ